MSLCDKAAVSVKDLEMMVGLLWTEQEAAVFG